MTPKLLTGALLAWYDTERRDLPWRAAPGAPADPYQVWVSEIMLQQTVVRTVIPYYQRFMVRWPRIEDLAAADLDEVLHGWQGLGYYARARNMHRCAEQVTLLHNGRFPRDEVALRRLPGIGDYTAAALAAIAFGLQAAPVDGNVIRVLARFHGLETPLPGLKKQIDTLARDLVPGTRPGDHAQALMDLGATVCTPRNPSCDLCPWRDDCKANALDAPETYPHRPPKKQRPVRRAIAFVMMRADGAILLRKRPPQGLLGGMMEFPSTEWREAPWNPSDAPQLAPVPGKVRLVSGLVEHTFTHFHLQLTVFRGTIDHQYEKVEQEGCVWCPADKLHQHALPTVMKKVVAHALRQP